MRALLDKIVLAACSSHLLPCIYFASQVSAERSAVNLIFLPIKVRDLLSLAALSIFSFSLEFASFTLKCRGVELFVF